MCKNARGTTTRAQSLEAPAVGPQILRACAVEMYIDDVERRECTVNSNELAVHAQAEQRSKHTCFSITVGTPSVTTGLVITLLLDPLTSCLGPGEKYTTQAGCKIVIVRNPMQEPMVRAVVLAKRPECVNIIIYVYMMYIQ